MPIPSLLLGLDKLFHEVSLFPIFYGWKEY